MVVLILTVKASMANPGVLTSQAFVDTNVLVYAFDTTDPKKHLVSNSLITNLVSEGRLCISVQVVHEFYSVLTKPSRPFRVSHEQAARVVSELIESASVISLTPEMTLSALAVVKVHCISFWDALIWAAAKHSNCQVIYSEDFQNGRLLDGIRYVNPFTVIP